MPELKRIAIIGASAAGVAAAFALRRAGFDGHLSLYGDDVREPYERPALTKTLSGGHGGIHPIVAPHTYSDSGIDLQLGQRVVGIRGRTVTLEDWSAQQYDSVLLATGASARRLQVPGARLGNILYLRNADDAERIASRLSTGGPLVVAGGGFVGLEVAAVARGLGIDVTLVESELLPFMRSAGPEVARLVADLHRDHGVRFFTGDRVTEFRGEREVAEARLASGRILPASTVVVGIGAEPNTSLAIGVGAACRGGVLVSAAGQSSVPWLWAAGDLATCSDPHGVTNRSIDHWDSARHQGHAVAHAMLGIATKQAPVPYVWSDQYELTYQSYGRAISGDSVVFREGSQPHQFLAFRVCGDRIHAVSGIGLPREVRAGKVLIEKQSIVDPRALRDPHLDLCNIP
ncbi:NAD(P)/FAD-dependent oxidoreductase [Granulicoccus phenolivorans]|uniref:NAD(P)/FAD-dependent oxidoreductase n=1 Tax=Granulicoccus phenolivorans TaxID=266854 RepID=UPI0005584F30|nr:FAD-dependent oxidoreductase [Granulicoccus phenolivorans]